MDEAAAEAEPYDAAGIAVASGSIALAEKYARVTGETGLGHDSLNPALSADGSPSVARLMKVAKKTWREAS